MEQHPERERKFLIHSFSSDVLKPDLSCWSIQGFFHPRTRNFVERVRIALMPPYFVPSSRVELTPEPSREGGGWRAFHDIKTRNTNDDWHSQIEASEELSLWAAWLILDRCVESRITKVRYRIPHGEHIVELDIFTKSELRGLVVAEIELSCAEEQIVLPDWMSNSVEVTEDPRFRNVNLSKISTKTLRVILNEYNC